MLRPCINSTVPSILGAVSPQALFAGKRVALRDWNAPRLAPRLYNIARCAGIDGERHETFVHSAGLVAAGAERERARARGSLAWRYEGDSLWQSFPRGDCGEALARSIKVWERYLTGDVSKNRIVAQEMRDSLNVASLSPFRLNGLMAASVLHAAGQMNEVTFYGLMKSTRTFYQKYGMRSLHYDDYSARVFVDRVEGRNRCGAIVERHFVEQALRAGGSLVSLDPLWHDNTVGADYILALSGLLYAVDVKYTSTDKTETWIDSFAHAREQMQASAAIVADLGVERPVFRMPALYYHLIPAFAAEYHELALHTLALGQDVDRILATPITLDLNRRVVTKSEALGELAHQGPDHSVVRKPFVP